MVLADDEVERALVVVAHPDDADFWAGGTVAGWTSAGIAVTYGVLSDGDSGGFDPQVPRSAVVAGELPIQDCGYRWCCPVGWWATRRLPTQLMAERMRVY